MGGWTVKVLLVLAKIDDNDGSNGNGRGIGENKMVVGDASCAWTRNVMSCPHAGRRLHQGAHRCRIIRGAVDRDSGAALPRRGGLTREQATRWRRGSPNCCRVESTSLERICSDGVEEVQGLSGHLAG